MSSDFHYEGENDGEYHCSNEDCDFWVPSGMEYLAESHGCKDWEEGVIEGVDIEEMLDDVIDAEDVEEVVEADIEEQLDSHPDEERIQELIDKAKEETDEE